MVMNNMKTIDRKWDKATFADIMSPAKVVLCGSRQDLPVLSITMHDGIVEQKDRFKKVIASHDTSKYKVVKNGQLVIAFPIDEGLIYTQDIASEGIMSPAYNVWDVNYENFDRRFLGLYFHSPFAMSYYKDNLRGTTQRRRALPKEVLLSMPIPKPSLSKQKEIVAELDGISSCISILNAQNSDLDTLAHSLFYDMFGDPILNEKGWPVKPLIEIVKSNCPITYGIVQPGEDIKDGVPVVRPVDMTETFISHKGLKRTTKDISDAYKRTILKGTEILMCVRGRTGLLSLATPQIKGCNVTRGITPIDCNELNDVWFIYYQLKSDGIQRYISDYTKGIALKQINMEDVRRIPLISPDLSIQKIFASKISSIEASKEALKLQINEMQNLLASRMQYWFD